MAPNCGRWGGCGAMDDLDDDDMDDEEDVDEVASGTGPWGDFVAFMGRFSSLWDFLDMSGSRDRW